MNDRSLGIISPSIMKNSRCSKIWKIYHFYTINNNIIQKSKADIFDPLWRSIFLSFYSTTSRWPGGRTSAGALSLWTLPRLRQPMGEKREQEAESPESQNPRVSLKVAPSARLSLRFFSTSFSPSFNLRCNFSSSVFWCTLCPFIIPWLSSHDFGWKYHIFFWDPGWCYFHLIFNAFSSLHAMRYKWKNTEGCYVCSV